MCENVSCWALLGAAEGTNELREIALPLKLIESRSARLVCGIAFGGWILAALADPKPLSLGQDYYPPNLGADMKKAYAS